MKKERRKTHNRETKGLRKCCKKKLYFSQLEFSCTMPQVVYTLLVSVINNRISIGERSHRRTGQTNEHIINNSNSCHVTKSHLTPHLACSLSLTRNVSFGVFIWMTSKLNARRLRKKSTTHNACKLNWRPCNERRVRFYMCKLKGRKDDVRRYKLIA